MFSTQKNIKIETFKHFNTQKTSQYTKLIVLDNV